MLQLKSRIGKTKFSEINTIPFEKNSKLFCRPHPHKLVGNGCANGFSKIYFEVTPEDNEYCFERLGVQCVKKTKVRESLDQRQRFKVDPFKGNFI